MKERPTLAFVSVLVFLILIRLPALTGTANLSPDATEYVDVAKNFAGGEGMTLKIRSYFTGDGLTMPYPAISLRSPLFPLAMGSLYWWVNNEEVFRWFNLLLFSVNMVLLALILRPLLPPFLWLYAILLVGLSEPMFLCSIFPWSEQFALFWLLLGLLLVSLQLHIRWGAAGAAVEGLVSAMAVLTRPEYGWVAVLILVSLWRDVRRGWVPAAFWASVLAPLLLFALASYLQYGRVFLPSGHHLQALSSGELYRWESQSSASLPEFWATHGLQIAERVVTNAVNYFAKLVGWKNLFLLALALPVVVRSGFDKNVPWGRRQLVLTALLFFAGYCLAWSALDRERYLISVTPFLIPLCLLETQRWTERARLTWQKYMGRGVMFAGLPLLMANVASANVTIQQRTGWGERFYANPNPAWNNPDVPQLAGWIEQNVSRGDVVCLENPFLLNYLTRRSCLLLPVGVQPDEFITFLRHYGVRFWINNQTFSQRPAEELECLAAVVADDGATLVRHCGSYQVWELTP